MKKSVMNRTKWEIEILEKMNINPTDREFLAQIGLPNLKHDELEFSNTLLAEVFEGTDCHRIGTYGILNEVPLFIRETIPGIWTIDEETNEPLSVNSTTKTFSKFISLREKYLLDIGVLIPPQIQEEFVLVIKKAMEKIDPIAMATSCIWNPFMEDICNQVTYYDDDF